MKRILYFISFICLKQVIAQTYVTIPDSNFAAYLRANVPAGMNGNQLDTSNISVKNLLVINVSNLNISSLSGIQYFPALNQLTCSSNSLTTLPEIPNSIQSIWCDNNRLTCLPSLPKNLTQLICSNNKLNNLSTLPNSLKNLWCDNNNLTSLPTLPYSLRVLYCDNNNLTSLPALPDSLQALTCTSNNIACLPIFPNTLTTLILYSNPFTCLPNYINCMSRKQNAIGAPLNVYPLCNLDNANGCPVSTDVPTQTIIPNIFTPNGDNINDTFLIKGGNLTNFNCNIYNRWGALIYQWANINSGWDGKKSGMLCDDGTYYYVITYTDNTNKVQTQKGFLQLIR